MEVVPGLHTSSPSPAIWQSRDRQASRSMASCCETHLPRATLAASGLHVRFQVLPGRCRRHPRRLGYRLSKPPSPPTAFIDPFCSPDGDRSLPMLPFPSSDAPRHGTSISRIPVLLEPAGTETIHKSAHPLQRSDEPLSLPLFPSCGLFPAVKFGIVAAFPVQTLHPGSACGKQRPSTRASVFYVLRVQSLPLFAEPTS